MPVKMTPPIYARGRYVLHAPWVADATKVYTNIAIRSFKDIYEDGLDPYEEFYKTSGIPGGEPGALAAFATDKAQLANIITLRADDASLIYVPDSYIAAFPNMGEVKYSYMVLALDFGAMPDYLDLTAIKTELQNRAAVLIGKIPDVQEARAPSANQPDTVQHDALEAARLGAITNMETDNTKYLKEKAQRLQAEATIVTLTSILQSHGWLPT